MKRRFLPVVVLASCGLLLLGTPFPGPGPTPAAASLLEEKEAELAQAQEEMERLGGEIETALREYRAREEKARTTRIEIDHTVEKIAETKRRLGEKMKELEARLIVSYKESHGSFPFVVQVLLGSDDLTRMLNALPHLVTILDADADLVHELNALEEELELRTRELAELRRTLLEEMRALEALRAELDVMLAKAEAEHARVEEEVIPLRAADALLKRAEAARSRWVGRVSRYVMRLANGFVFPVDGAHSYYNDWGEPRPEDRSHRGTDIFARRGTPVVAAARGVIKATAYRRPLGGTIIWLRGYNGIHYYYAHLGRVLPGIRAGAEVEAGIPIGTVGSTGNAAGGPPHLHFQIHPRGGGPVNPYWILRISD